MKYIILFIITLFNIGLWLSVIFVLSDAAAAGVGVVSTIVTFIWLFILCNELDNIQRNKIIDKKEEKK